MYYNCLFVAITNTAARSLIAIKQASQQTSQKVLFSAFEKNLPSIFPINFRQFQKIIKSSINFSILPKIRDIRHVCYRGNLAACVFQNSETAATEGGSLATEQHKE